MINHTTQDTEKLRKQKEPLEKAMMAQQEVVNEKSSKLEEVRLLQDCVYNIGYRCMNSNLMLYRASTQSSFINRVHIRSIKTYL